MVRLLPTWLAVIVIALPAAGCEESPSGPLDGSPGESVLPRDSEPGESTVGGSVDFVVQGCEERTADRCSGTVPLTLAFSAVLQNEPVSISWDPGDGSKPKTSLVVTHTYDKPGLYDVSLTVGEGAGTTSELKVGFVEVRKAAAGFPCVADGSCISDKCVCAGTCPFPLDQGLCLQECELSCPDKGTRCVDLEVKGVTASEPWRSHLCLQECTTDAQCLRPGFACRLAPAVQGWQQVCLPQTVHAIGDPCRMVDGSPNPHLCAGGLCLNIGASGYCSWPCKANTCPEGTRCAKFASSDVAVCLLRCEQGLCQNDPALACELPGGAGDHSFNILGTQPPSGTRFCSVKRCVAPADCGLAGQCDAGFCLP